MKRVLFILLAVFITNIVHAQIIDPVKWKYSVKQLPNNEAELIFEAKIDAKWHLYSQFFEDGGPVKMTFSFEKSDAYQLLGKVQEFTPKTEHDEIFDIDVQYFENQAKLIQKIKILSTKDFVVRGEMEYQVCYEDKCVLFNPDFEFQIKGASAVQKSDNNIKTVQTETDNKELTDKTKETTKDSTVLETNNITLQDLNNTVADTSEHITPITNASDKLNIDNGSLWWLFWISFLAGLLAILTPCVFPMIPMTVTFFLKEGENKAKGRMQALFYGFSIILIYTVIGTLVAVLFGVNFANWLSTHWIPNVLFFLIFMLFAASFFGMFEIVMPSWLVNKSVEKEDKAGFMAPFFMAFTLVLVSFSCTGPLVGAILVQSAGGAVLEPIVGMLGFSLAFALPFTLFAFFPSWLSNLPKSGGWLNSVKVVLGFIEVALGLKFLSIADQTYHWGILDREIYLAIWIVLAILLGMYLLGKLKFAHDSDLPYLSVPRFFLAVASFTFAVYLIPGMWGAPLKALSGYLPPMSSHDFDMAEIIRENNTGATANFEENTLPEKPKYSEFLHLPHGLKGYFDYEQALRVAKKLNKPLFLDFTGHGCVNCREMEANVWAAPEVLKRLKNDYVIVALYVDDKTKLPENEWVTSTFDGKVKKTIGKKFADFQITRFQVNAQPYYVLLDANGELLVQPRAYDLNVDDFVDFLDKGKKEFEKRNKK